MFNLNILAVGRCRSLDRHCLDQRRHMVSLLALARETRSFA
jgi:hypothetical protein